jgi:hypothetical protein
MVWGGEAVTLLADSYVARLQQDAIDFAAGGPLPAVYVRKVAEDVIADVLARLAEINRHDVGGEHGSWYADAIKRQDFR